MAAKLTEQQQRALDRLKKSLANHKEKPTEETKAVALRQYQLALAQTLTAESLDKGEVATLRLVTETPAAE